MSQGNKRDATMLRVLTVFDDYSDPDAADLEQWLELSGHERMMIGEAMREEAFESDDSGFSRVLRFVECPLAD